MSVRAPILFAALALCGATTLEAQSLGCVAKNRTIRTGVGASVGAWLGFVSMKIRYSDWSDESANVPARRTLNSVTIGSAVVGAVIANLGFNSRRCVPSAVAPPVRGPGFPIVSRDVERERRQRAIDELLVAHRRDSAMNAASGASVAGLVWDSLKASPVSGASVRIAGLEREVRTDTTGRFRFGALLAGRHDLQVRRLGYAGRDTTLEVAGPVVAVVKVAAAQLLAQVEVSAPVVSARMAGFEERRKQGQGRFITAEELEKVNHRQLTDVVAGLGGSLRIIRNQGVGYLSNGQQQAAGALREGTAPPASKQMVFSEATEGGRLRGCLVQIYVDGLRIYGMGPDKNETPPNIDEFLVRNIQAIEFYSSPSTTPAEFQSTTSQCGTLVIWTRER